MKITEKFDVRRGLRHRNLSAIRHATQRGLHQLQQLHGGHGNEHGNQIKARGAPLMIQGFRSNPKDPESHILFFDIEALIGTRIFHFLIVAKKQNVLQAPSELILKSRSLFFELKMRNEEI